MMDEQLIDEVAQHGVIYNRQKYYLNGSASGGKYETKDEAWQLIAIKLRTDVETCKKRWKYLRERYVSQRKQGDPPVYEHLSRPYLEKMKFLDQHIQPRKSYRNVPNFLTSPHSANSSNYGEFNVDSKSNSSHKNMSHFGATQNHHYHQHQQPADQQHTMNALSTAAASALENVNGQVKIEAEIFRDFAAAVASQQLQHISQSQMQQQQAAAVAAVMADSSQGYQEPYRDNLVVGNAVQNSGGSTGGLTSTSSSMKSPLSSPLPGMGVPSQEDHPGTAASQQPTVHSSSSVADTGNNLQVQTHGYSHKSSDEMHSSTSGNYHSKKPRLQLNSNGSSHSQHVSNGGGGGGGGGGGVMSNPNGQFGHDSDDDSDDNSNDIMEPQTMLQHDNHYSNSLNMQRNAANGTMNNNNNNNNNNNGNNNNNNNQQQQQQQQQHQHQNMFPSNTDFLFQLYQQLPQQAGTSHPNNFGKFQAPTNPHNMQRSSEHLLGELVTMELLKMNKDRRKQVQKRILEILFFDD